MLRSVPLIGLAGLGLTQPIDSGVLESMQLKRMRRHHRCSPRQHRLPSPVMLQRVVVERKSTMPGWQNWTSNVFLRLQRSIRTHA